MKLASSKIDNNFYKIFKPQLTPKKMFELGGFGCFYFEKKIKEFPKSRYQNAKLRKKFDVNKNRFRVAAGLSGKDWLEKGWIFKEDPLGWFQWYCRFVNGRRIPHIDEIQIKRWRAFKRHVSAIKKNCEPGNIHCRKKQRQAILPVTYTHLRAHETLRYLVCRLLLEKKNTSKRDQARYRLTSSHDTYKSKHTHS